MSTKMFNEKSAIAAGTVLTAGLALGAVQSQTNQTVHADTVDNNQVKQAQTSAASQSATDLQTAQSNYNKQKEIVANRSAQAQDATNVANESKAKLDAANQNLTNLEKGGNQTETEQNISKQQQVIANTQAAANDASQKATDHQQQVVNAQNDYDQANQAVQSQTSKTTQAENAAKTAQAKIDQTKETQLTKAQNDAQTKLDQDNAAYQKDDQQLQKDQAALIDAQTNLEPAKKSVTDAEQKLNTAKTANDQAQDAKSTQLNKVTQKQVAYDQEFGKNGTLGMLEKQVDANVDYENTVTLPYTLSQLRAANDQSSDQDWQQIVTASEKAYQAENNQFKSEAKGEDTEAVDPKNLTPAQARELSEYTLRIINSARSQLNLPKWTYGLNTQGLANDIAADYDEHKRSNRQGHYVEGIVREANKHGLKIDNNYVEDMYSFYAPLDKPMTMTEVKKALYDNLKGMLLGNVCNPGSDPEYHHANSFLCDDPATYALSISNQKEDDHDFATTHFINVTSGQHKAADGGTIYTGTVDLSKLNGGSWEVDPDADQAINEQIAQLKEKSAPQLKELNDLKQILAGLNQAAVNTQVAYTAAKSAYDQANNNLQTLQKQIDQGQTTVNTGNAQLTKLKQELTSDKEAVTKAKDALAQFKKENEQLVADYQAKAATAKQEQAKLASLTKTASDKQNTLNQVKADQTKLDQFANEAATAVKTAKQLLAKQEDHLAALKSAAANQESSAQDYQTKVKLADDLSQKLRAEQQKLDQAQSSLDQAQKLAALDNASNVKREDGDSEVVLPNTGDQQNKNSNQDNGQHFLVSHQDDQQPTNLTYSIDSHDQTTKHNEDQSNHILLKENHHENSNNHNNNTNINISNSFNQTKKVVKKVYVPIVNHNRNWRINVYNNQGQATQQTIATDTTWPVYERMLIGTDWYYRIGENQWLPQKYVKVANSQTTAEQAFNAIAYIINTSGMIPLLDANGNFTGKYINPNTAWKVWAVKWINGQEMVRIGTENQWVSMEYVAQLLQN